MFTCNSTLVKLARMIRDSNYCTIESWAAVPRVSKQPAQTKYVEFVSLSKWFMPISTALKRDMNTAEKSMSVWAT